MAFMPSDIPRPRSLFIQCVPYAVTGIILIAMVPFASSYIRYVMTKILIYGVFAMSLNLLYGYTGLFCLGHAAFFGVGGYAAGILITRYGLQSFWLVAPISMFVVLLVAACFGIIALQTKGLFFLFITLALGQLSENVATKWRGMTGGSNGLVGIPYPVLGLTGSRMSPTSFCILVIVVFVGCLFLLDRLTRSPFGVAMQGIRDDEGRMAHLGYHTWLHKYLVFIIGGVFAGMAGVLFGHLNGIIVPAHLGVTTSAMALLMVIMGGTSAVFGPALGAASVTVLELLSSIYTPERWPLILGSSFIVVVLFFRGGIALRFVNLWNRLKRHYGSTQN
jgi:branched-chain amino acid transport system permease protein